MTNIKFCFLAIFFLLLFFLFLPAINFQQSIVHAQAFGTGHDVIKPVEKLWLMSRNLSYLIIIIVFVVVGIMIMMRKKINPQTVISIQAALPGLVIALILITFSFFIASLIIDLAFILAQIFGIAVIVALTGQDIVKSSGIITDILNNKNLFTHFTDFLISGGDLGGTAGTIGDVIKPIFDAEWPKLILAFIVNTLFSSASFTSAGGGIAGIITQIPRIIGVSSSFFAPDKAVSLVVFIILFIALLSAMFKLFLGLIGAYVAIVLNTILGPFLILFSAVPGKGNSITQWVQGLLANVLIFPAVFGIFVLAAAILNVQQSWGFSSNSVGAFNQPLPLFGGLPENFIRYILAYGMLLASPGIPDYIRQLLGSAQPQQLSQAVTQSTGAGTSGVGALGSRIGNIFKRPKP